MTTFYPHVTRDNALHLTSNQEWKPTMVCGVRPTHVGPKSEASTSTCPVCMAAVGDDDLIEAILTAKTFRQVAEGFVVLDD